MNCPYCGVKLKEIGDNYFCPNHGLIDLEPEEVDKPDRSYIG